MTVVLSVEDTGPCRKEVKVEVPSEAVGAETELVVKEYRRKARLPGFRKGKAPASVVRKRYREAIDQEVVERLVPRFWEQARTEAELETLIAPRVERVEHEDGQPMVFTASVEVKPEIEVSENREFDLPSGEVLVGEAEVDDVLEQLRRSVAPWKETDRPAARGDRVSLRIRPVGAPAAEAEEGDAAGDPANDAEDDAEPGEDADEGVWQDTQIELGDERVWEELSLAATGLEPGGRTTFRREAPAQETGAPPDAAPAQEFEIEVRTVEEKDLPVLDEAFAQEIGDFESVEALRESIEHRILHDKIDSQKKAREQALLDQLIQRHPLELPPGVIQEEVEAILREYAESLAQRGVDLEKARIDWVALSEEVRPQATKQVHARLVLDAVAAADGVQVEDQEVEEAVASIARAQKSSPASLRLAMQKSGRLKMLRLNLLREKTVRHLLGDPPEQEHSHDHDHE